MTDFQEALGGILASTSVSNPRRRRGRRPARARHNMALTYKGVTVDTPEELRALIALEASDPAFRAALEASDPAPASSRAPASASSRAPSQAAVSPWAATQRMQPSDLAAVLGAGKKTSASRKPRRAKSAEYSGPRQPDGPVSYRQARLIGASIGGLESYCPAALWAQKEAGEKVSHQMALTQMGLTAGGAHAVLDELTKRGLRTMGKVSPENAQKARRILEEVGGVTCPMPSRKNPKHFAW